MKYEVTYSCGHTAVVDLVGKGIDRERKLEWMRERALCPECYKAKVAAEHQKFESKMDFPVLSGTDKQIAYANKLRLSYAKQEINAIEQYKKANAYTDDEIAVIAEKMNTTVEFLKKDRENVTKTKEPFCTIHKIYTVTNAGQIIDLLKSRV